MKPEMFWAHGLPPRQQRLDQWLAPRRNKRAIQQWVSKKEVVVEDVEKVIVETKKKVEVVSLGSEDGDEEVKGGEEAVQVAVESKKKVEVVSLGSEDDIEEAGEGLRVSEGEPMAQVSSGLKRKAEVVSLGSEDEEEERMRAEEVIQVSVPPNKRVEIVSLGSEEEDIEEEEVTKAIYQIRRTPVVLSQSSENNEEGEQYDGDGEYVEEEVDGDHSDDEYLYEEEGELEVNSQDGRSPSVIKWLEGVNGEVIDISSGEPISISRPVCTPQHPLHRSLTFNSDSDSDADSVIPRSNSNNNMSPTNRRHSNSINAASLLRAFEGDKSISLRNGEPFISSSEQQDESITDSNLLDFTSPSPPASPGIRPCDSILKGFGYATPVLDFTDDVPLSAIDHTILTTDLILGEDQQNRSVSRSPGLVDHSPSPSTSSSNNASSHLDRFSGSESEHDEPRYQTPPSRQFKRPSPPPAPRKRYTQREIHVGSEYGVASDEYLEEPSVGEPHGNPPLNKNLLQKFPLEEQAEETRTEEYQERPAKKCITSINTGLLPGLGNSLLKRRTSEKRHMETSSEEEQGNPAKRVVRPISGGLRPGLGQSIFKNSFRAQQEQPRKTLSLSEATTDDRSGNRDEPEPEQVPSVQAASVLQENLSIEQTHPNATSFSPTEDEIGHEGEERELDQDIRESPKAPQDRPEKVWPAAEASASSSITSSNAPFTCKYGCSRNFGKKHDRNYHYRHVHGTEMFKCKHGGCDQEFLWQEKLKKHMAVHGLFKAKKPASPLSVTTEGSKASFACSNCTKSYTTNVNLRRHVQDRHEKRQSGGSASGERVSNPKVQEQPRQNPDDLNKDTMKIPAPSPSRAGPTPSLTGGDVWTCVFPDCGSHHCKAANLEQHYRLKHNVRLYECSRSQCDEKFTHQGKQKEHEKTCRRAGGQADEVVNLVEEASQPQTITPSELMKSPPPNMSPASPPPPAGSAARGFKCTICMQSSDPVTRRRADHEVFLQIKDLNQHHQSAHFTPAYRCSICDEGFSHKREYLEHKLKAHEYFDPYEPEPPVFDAVEQDHEKGMSPFDLFQPPSGFPDLRLMNTPEHEQVSDTLSMWTSGPGEGVRYDQGPLMPLITTVGQVDAPGKAAVVYTIPNSSHSSSLPSVGKLFSNWDQPVHNGEAMDGYGEKSEMQGLPMSNILDPAPNQNQILESNGGFSPQLYKDIAPSEFGVSMFGRKRKRPEERIGDGNDGSVLMRDDDYDSDEELKFPSIKRKRLMNKRTMKELKEEGKLKIELIE